MRILTMSITHTSNHSHANMQADQLELIEMRDRTSVTAFEQCVYDFHAGLKLRSGFPGCHKDVHIILTSAVLSRTVSEHLRDRRSRTTRTTPSILIQTATSSSIQQIISWAFIRRLRPYGIHAMAILIRLLRGCG